MKPARVLLVAAAAIGVAALALVIVAFTSSAQTWAVHRVLARHPDLPLTIGRVSAGLNRVHLENVRYATSGAVLNVPVIDAELPLISAARQKILARRVVARGWTIDLTQTSATPAARAMTAPRPEASLIAKAAAQGAPAAVAPALFAGIFDHLKLPVDLALDGVDVRGEIIFPAVANQPARASVTVMGGGLAAGRPGSFDYTCKIVFSGDNGPVRDVTVRGNLGVLMDTPRTFARLVSTNEAEAIGPSFPTGVKLTVDASAARSAHGEVYAGSIVNGAKQLAAIETSYPAGASHVGGNWRLDMRDADLAPFSFGRELPVFEAAGEGRFDTDTAFAEVRASGHIKATMDRLRVINEDLSGFGSVAIMADFDFAQRDNATRVDQLAVAVNGTGPIATLQALQAFEFNLHTGELNVANPSNELLGVSLQGVPLAWFAPLLAKHGIVASGDDLTGGFSASARNGGFTIRPRDALTIAKLRLGQTDGTPWLYDVDVSLTGSADYTPEGWQVQVSPFSARSAAGTVLSVTGKIGQLAGRSQPMKVTGSWSGHLPALLGQPIASKLAALTSGDAQGTFAANLDDKLEVELRLALTNLAAAMAPGLPAVTLDMRVDREPDGKVTFSSPIKIERDGRKSDLALAGTLVPQSPRGLSVDGRISSEFLALEDAQILAAPFAKSASAADGRTAPAPGAVPAWEGISGQISLALKKVIYNRQFQVTDLSGTLRIEAGTIKLINGTGGFDENSDVKFAGGVTYDGARPQAYSLAADFALNNFDTAPAFRAIDGTRVPTVEARINLSSKLSGSGASLMELARQTRGDLLITSRAGIFRVLSADLNDRIQRTQSRVTAIASFLGVVPDDYVNKTKILADITKALSEIPFDQLSLTATRDESLNLVLRNFTLISPEVRIEGEGEIRHVESVPVLAQPMDLRLNLGARGKLGDLIKRAGLLESREDGLGYAAFAVPLRIRGTLGNPDTNEIRNALLNSALERSGMLDSLLGK